MKTRFARWIALAAMASITVWSVWGWTQTHKEQGHPSADKPAAAEPAESEAPPPINWTEFDKETPPFLATLINFGILAAGYYLLGKKSIAAGLVARRDSIAKEIEEAQRMKAEAEQRAKTYQGRLERLDEEARQAREVLVRAGEAERDRIIADAESTADRLRKDAEFLVLQEIKQVRQDLWREAVETAVTAAEEMLKKRVTPADQERLAEAFLGELGDRSRALSGPPPAPRRVEPGAGNPS
jgi:F0F1-type ATP synthase membrane subunit b/b'